MPREETEIILSEDGTETHESWIMIGASKVQSTGVYLFDSEIKHGHFITVRVSRCTRRRDLNHDWINSTKTLMEFAMSHAQWGAFVSSFGEGNGVPATLLFDQSGQVASAPVESRLHESAKDVLASGDAALANIREDYDELRAAFERGAGKREMRDLIFSLGCRIDNGPKNMEFAADSLTRHTENVVTKARADMEAMAAAAMDRGDQTLTQSSNPFLLEPGEE
jgi:hypothetical protein